MLISCPFLWHTSFIPIQLFYLENSLNLQSKEINDLAVHISETQLDFFGNGKNYVINPRALKFCIKKHNAKKYKLHYDIRLQFSDSWLKSFAVKPGPSMNQEMISGAVLVEDHGMSAFRREGTILEGVGEGSIIHYDEGYFTIPGVQNLRELRKELQAGLNMGSFNIVFCGYKIKGEFKFREKHNTIKSEWSIQKARDEFSTNSDVLLQDESILSGKTLDYYTELYWNQRSILTNLKPDDHNEFIRNNNRDSFIYSRYQLPPRPNKLLPYD